MAWLHNSSSSAAARRASLRRLRARKRIRRQHVIILEKTATLLAKVRISGGGRCNVTNACFDPAVLVQHYPRGGAALRGPFTRFQPRDTIDWFARHGVPLKTEADGRVFPTTDRSSTIVECLIKAAQQADVEIRTSVTIDAIERGDRSGFVVRSRTGEPLSADRVLLATGSNRHGYDWAAALGHTIEPPVPSLFTFAIDDPRLQGSGGNLRAERAGSDRRHTLATARPGAHHALGLERPGHSEIVRVGRARLARSTIPDRRAPQLAARSE